MLKRRRGNNEGSIYQMQDGRWRAAVSLGWKETAGGHKAWKRRVITGASRHEVADQMKIILGDQQRGINVDLGKKTLGTFLTDWLQDTENLSVRVRTYGSYEQMIPTPLV